MLRRAGGRLLLLLAVASGLLGLGAPAALAAAYTSGTATVVLDGAPWQRDHATRRFSSDGGVLLIGGSRREIHVDGSNDDDTYFSLSITAPEGRELAPGVYDHAIGGRPDRYSDQPGLDVSSDGSSCSDSTGRFEIQEVAFDGTGHPTRLRMVYETRCLHSPHLRFGEIRVGGAPPSGLSSVPSLVRWPLTQPGADGAVVPVAIRAPEVVQIKSVAVVGPDAGAMPIRLDDCSGRTVHPGEVCEVFVRFDPVTAGTRTATLRVVATSGETADVRLQGFAHGGRTRLTMRTDAGDYPGAGQSWSFAPPTSLFVLQGSRYHVGMALTGPGGAFWQARFSPGAGDILMPGRYASAASDMDKGTSPGLQVGADGSWCFELEGEFTITEATFNPEGILQTFGVDFAQRCETARGFLRGTLEYRAGDTTPPPPWTVVHGVVGPPAPLVPPSGPPPPPSATPEPAAPAAVGAPNLPQPVTVTAPAKPASSASADAVPPDRTGDAGLGPAPTRPAASAPAAGPAAAPVSGPPPGAVASKPAASVAPCRTGRWRQLGARADRVSGTGAAEWIRGGAGADRLRLAGGDDCADGGAGADRLDGGAGADVLAGGSGNDVLAGGSGNDTLDGGPGRDRLDCGPGRGDVARVGPGDVVKSCERVVRTRVR